MMENENAEKKQEERPRVRQSNNCKICGKLFSYELPRGMIHSLFPIRDKCDACRTAIEIKEEVRTTAAEHTGLLDQSGRRNHWRLS